MRRCDEIILGAFFFYEHLMHNFTMKPLFFGNQFKFGSKYIFFFIELKSKLLHRSMLS